MDAEFSVSRIRLARARLIEGARIQHQNLDNCIGESGKKASHGCLEFQRLSSQVSPVRDELEVGGNGKLEGIL